MRQAEIDKAWQDCRAVTKKRLDVQSLTISRNSISQTIPIKSRVNALLGENGAGKTTFLSTIAQIVKSNSYPNLIYSGSKISLKHNNNPYTFPIIQAPESPLGEHKNPTHCPIFEVINASEYAHAMVAYLKGQKNLSEYFSQLEAQTISTNELSEFSLVTGIRYSEIRIIEFESPLDPDDYLPYFTVRIENEIAYDSLNMGFGELCAFIVIWRIRRSQRGQAVLLDEPDSHLSPNARRRMVDFFAVKAADKDLCIIFSTHSVESIEKMEHHELLLMARSHEMNALPISVGADKKQAYLRLGLTLSRRFLLIVEDVDSHELVNQVFRKFQPLIAKACEIIPLIKGGEEIAKIANDFPKNTSICCTIAILDGDKKSSIVESDGVLFLPFSSDPIAAAKEWVETHINEFASKLQLSEDQVQEATTRCRHVDYHDYCSELASRLALPGVLTKDVRRALLSAWLTDSSVSYEFEFFALQIFERIVNSPIYNNQN